MKKPLNVEYTPQVLGKGDIIKTYIEAYNRGKVKHMGAAYNRLMQLIPKYFASERARQTYINKINHRQSFLNKNIK